MRDRLQQKHFHGSGEIAFDGHSQPRIHPNRSDPLQLIPQLIRAAERGHRNRQPPRALPPCTRQIVIRLPQFIPRPSPSDHGHISRGQLTTGGEQRLQAAVEFVGGIIHAVIVARRGGWDMIITGQAAKRARRAALCWSNVERGSAPAGLVVTP